MKRIRNEADKDGQNEEAMMRGQQNPLVLIMMYCICCISIMGNIKAAVKCVHFLEFRDSIKIMTEV